MNWVGSVKFKFLYSSNHLVFTTAQVNNYLTLVQEIAQTNFATLFGCFLSYTEFDKEKQIHTIEIQNFAEECTTTPIFEERDRLLELVLKYCVSLTGGNLYGNEDENVVLEVEQQKPAALQPEEFKKGKSSGVKK